MSLEYVTSEQMIQGQWYCIIAGDEIESPLIKHRGHGTEKSVGGYIQDVWRRKVKNNWQYIFGMPERVKEEIIIQEYIPYKKLKVLGQKSGQTRFYAYQHNDIHNVIDGDNKMFWG